MDDQCKYCPLLCKRLDPEDSPVRYQFNNLTPSQVIALIEGDLWRYSTWHHLEVEQASRSTGNQLSVLLRVQYRQENDEDCELVLIVQAEAEANQPTEVYFRYGVTDNYCRQPAARGFSTMITEILQSLQESDWLLAPRPDKNRLGWETAKS